MILSNNLTGSSLDFFPIALLPMVDMVQSETGWSHEVTISYTYDPLTRLTEADYSDSRQFEYTYDAVGNRLTQTIDPGDGDPLTTEYQYDIANRLWYVDAQEYTWDNNGNLLDDGIVDYTYDHANRLASLSGNGIGTTTYSYNGLGDRLEQSNMMEGVEYTLDLAGGLTQVLSDETHFYLYGNGRIGEELFNSWEYHLSDGLGSVRQLTDHLGGATLAKEYEPYGEVLGTAGNASTAYGYTGEWTDNSGLVYLRARYYDPTIGRFMTKDTWPGHTSQPTSYNSWLYASANPINLIDPYGKFSIDFPLEIPSWLAVLAAKTAYSNAGPIRFCLFHPNDGQWPSDTVNDLLTDYICEYGDPQRLFDADTHLTQELARSLTIYQLRREFSLGLIDHNFHRYSFGGSEFIIASIDSWKENDQVYFDIIPVDLSLPMNITHFLGSFDYKITWAGNRIRFQVENTTDLSSGTRIPPILGGVDPLYAENATSIEEVIWGNPFLANETVSSLMAQYPIISILRAKDRSQTQLLEGGGNMSQTFVWYEHYDPCAMYILAWPFFSNQLIIEK